MSRGLIHLSDGSYGFGLVRRDPRPPRGDIPWYAGGVTVRKVDENSTAISATNTASETTIANLSLPALTLSSTGAARLTATGTILNNSTRRVTFRIKAIEGSSTDTVLASTAVLPAASTSPHAWAMEFWLLGKQPNVNRGWGVLDIATAGAGGTLKPSTYSGIGFSTMGLDETDEWSIRITAQMSGATTAMTVTRQVAILEAIN